MTKTGRKLKAVDEKKVHLSITLSPQLAEYARQTPLGGTVAHGMLVLAYISQIMTAAFGHDWLAGGKLNVRFRAPARPGDVITVSGTIRRIEKTDGLQTVDCDVLCSNQNDEPVITGDAKIKVGE